MPGHVHLLGAIRGVGLTDGGQHIIIQTCDSEYDLTIYFGAGDGGWMNSTIKYKRRGTVARADQS
jgi:hypothetical protein